MLWDAFSEWGGMAICGEGDGVLWVSSLSSSKRDNNKEDLAGAKLKKKVRASQTPRTVDQYFVQ